MKRHLCSIKIYNKSIFNSTKILLETKKIECHAQERDKITRDKLIAKLVRSIEGLQKQNEEKEKKVVEIQNEIARNNECLAEMFEKVLTS